MQAEQRLRRQAEMRGESIEAFARSILERSGDSLAEAALPLREAVRKSGMSEAEIEDFVDDLVREVRNETPLRSR